MGGGKFIGGEYYYSPLIFFKKKLFDIDEYLNSKHPKKHVSFTFGGYYSILEILTQIKLNPNDVVLIPSYICPTILIPFKKLNIKYRFFRINEKLEVDINDLKKKIDDKVKAIFYINYFGFTPHIDFIKLIELLKKDVIIIEDIVHSFLSNNKIIGDYAFNSFRKFFPLDGSFIISNKEIKTNHLKSYNSYFYNKLSGQILRYINYEWKIDTTKLFIKQFSKAEECYYQDIKLEFNSYNRFILSRFNIENICDKRRNNFHFILNKLGNISLYKSLNNNIVPSGFPILLENRNIIRNKMIEKNIFCPIHWKLSDEIDKKEYQESWYLSEKIMTIPINENIDKKSLDYFLINLNNSLI